MSLNTFKCRFKSMAVTILIVALAVAVFISVNSAVEASNGYIKKSLLETPLLRTMYIFSEDAFTKEELERLKGDKRVESAFEFSYGLCVDVENELIKEKTATLTPFFSSYDNYIVAGRGAQEDYEIVLPYYVEKGSIESTDYYKRDKSLLDKEIKIKYKVYNFYTLEFIEEKEVMCKIVGFYDNGSAGRCGDDYLIYDKSLTSLIKSVDYKPVDYEELKRAAEYMGFENVEMMVEAYAGERVPGELGICAVSYEATKSLERDYELHRYAKVDENVEYEFDLFKKIGSVLSLIIMITALMNIVISTISNINKREWEFALKQAMGFTRGKIYKEIIIEMLIIAVIGIVIGLIGTKGIIYIIKNQYMISKNIMYLTMDIRPDINYIVNGMILSIIPSIAGTIIGIIKVRGINIAETLKNEEKK